MTYIIVVSDSEPTGEIFQLTEIDFVYIYGVTTIVHVFYESITDTTPEIFTDMNFLHWN